MMSVCIEVKEEDEEVSKWGYLRKVIHKFFFCSLLFWLI